MAPTALTAGEVARLVGGELVGPANTEIVGVASLREAGPGDLSFLATTRYLPYFQATSAGAVLVAPEFRGLTAGPATRIVVSDPRAALRRILDVMMPEQPPEWGVHPTATIGPGTRWAGRIVIGPAVTIGRNVRLGNGCRLGAFARIGDGAVLGAACTVGAHAHVAAGATLGDRVAIETGARVGLAGFSFVEEGSGYGRLGHVGACRIADDVSVGANSTVARGSIDATVIGKGTKIDTLVQVGHNVRIGERCLIMAQVGIAGTTTIGNDVIIAGQAGLAGHLAVGDGARLAAQSGVIGDVPAGATVSGYPARDHRSVLRQAASLRRLTPIIQTLEHLAHDER